MKKQILILGFCFLFPLSLLAHGESPAMFTIMGYIIIIPIIVGLIEYFLMKKRIEIKDKGKLKTILINIGVTIIGYLIVFYIVESLKIENERIVILLIMLFLSIVQIVSKILLYKQLIIINKDDFSKMNKLIFYSTAIINSFFILIIMILI
jgi:hypothetical protein